MHEARLARLAQTLLKPSSLSLIMDHQSNRSSISIPSQQCEATSSMAHPATSGNPSNQCIHGKAQNGYFCKECPGKGICFHGKQKHLCTLGCGGSSICSHGKPKNRCKLGCGGASICSHGKQKSLCNLGCGGSSICSHGKQKSHCKLGCGGSSICSHGKRKNRCTLGCGGSSICSHGKRKSRCKLGCSGSAICVHNRIKYSCKDCKRLSPATHLQTHASDDEDTVSIGSTDDDEDDIGTVLSTSLVDSQLEANTSMPPASTSNQCIHGKGQNGYYCKECPGKGICSHGKKIATVN